jgi:hypothetical protein
MGFQLANQKALDIYLQKMQKRIESALIYNLEYMVAELENHAKLNAEYTDRTSNLKSSIGGVILKNGRPVSYVGFTGTKEGNSEGNTFLDEIIAANKNGYVLILVAGMGYATYVEDIYGLNVLKKSELKMRTALPQMLRDLKTQIDENQE